jgi:sigma-B regulation protein RsbU (phosphoserine phosphatase)
MPLADDLPDFAQLYAEAPCGLVLTTPDGTIQRVNQTFCRWVGHDAEALVGCRSLQSLLSTDGQTDHRTRWGPLLQRQGAVADVRLELMHRDGRCVPMLLNAVRRAHGSTVFDAVSVVVAGDLQSELDRRRTAAQDRALFSDQIVGLVGHELRSPLSVIHMSAAVLRRGALAAAQQACVERITRAVDRAQRLIADLLDFTAARVGSGLPVIPKPFELHALVADTIAVLRPSFPERRLEHAPSGAGPCVADAERVRQLLIHLVTNALTHGAADRPVQVRSAIETDAFVLSVHNDGDPIDAALLPTLFEPLIRGPTSAAPRVGLGLFIVREIVRAHRGQVRAESLAGHGTTVTATFPRAAPSA